MRKIGHMLAGPIGIVEMAIGLRRPRMLRSLVWLRRRKSDGV